MVADPIFEYVGMDLNGLPRPFGERVGVRGIVGAKKAKDGVWDVVVNVKKFNREIFDDTMKNIQAVPKNGGWPHFLPSKAPAVRSFSEGWLAEEGGECEEV